MRERRIFSSKAGFTLVEVAIALGLVTILVTVLVQTIGVARRLTYANAQRVAAFGMCKARLETVRGMDYESVDPTNFVDETDLRFLHLSGRERIPIACTRSVDLATQTNPVRTDVTVNLQWQFLGNVYQESVTGTVYPR